MAHFISWMSERIRRLAHRLEFELFLSEERRARYEAELSDLLKKREKYHETKRREAEEKRLGLKSHGPDES